MAVVTGGVDRCILELATVARTLHRILSSDQFDIEVFFRDVLWLQTHDFKDAVQPFESRNGAQFPAFLADVVSFLEIG